MSTRAQIIIKDSCTEIWFYRHSDGYRDGVKPTLDLFCAWIKEGLIRKDAMQAAGWLVMLVMIGAGEYRRVYNGPDKTDGELLKPCQRDGSMGWKVGSYEPDGAHIHGDVEHLWIVDVEKATWKEDVTRLNALQKELK